MAVSESHKQDLASSSRTHQGFTLQRISLVFPQPSVEGAYLQEVARTRWPILLFSFAFDVVCYTFRFVVKLWRSMDGGRTLSLSPIPAALVEIAPQLANMALLYLFIGLLNRRSRKLGDVAARQEEMLLSTCMAMAICNLLASLTTENSQDYVYVCFFLICTSTFLKIRWWVGTLVLMVPMVLANLWHRDSEGKTHTLPHDALVHMVVAWAVGGLMAYLAEWYRRQMFASQRLAQNAHNKELLEAQARIKAQRALAKAQAQAAQRALSVAREKAANEAKSEFMSLMCHEVRTPLNGCLASAEMLLETVLDEEQHELATTIRVSGSILLSTVSNFLDFFKMEAGKTLDIVRTEADVVQLVSDVHCIIAAMMGSSTEVCLLHPDLLLSVEHIVCDPDRVRGVLLNLYTNAAKFTKTGHIGMRVREVHPDYLPSPGPEYSSITVKPSYMPHSAQQRRQQQQKQPQQKEQEEQRMGADGNDCEKGDSGGGAADELGIEIGRGSSLEEEQQHQGGSWRRQLRSLLSLIDGSNAATHAADSLHSASMGNRSSSHLAPPHHHHQQQQQHAAGLGGKGGLQRSDSGTTMDSSVTGSSVTAPLHRLSGSSAMQRPTSAEMRLHRRQLRWQPPPVDAGPVGAEGILSSTDADSGGDSNTEHEDIARRVGAEEAAVMRDLMRAHRMSLGNGWWGNSSSTAGGSNGRGSQSGRPSLSGAWLWGVRSSTNGGGSHTNGNGSGVAPLMGRPSNASTADAGEETATNASTGVAGSSSIGGWGLHKIIEMSGLGGSRASGSSYGRDSVGGVSSVERASSVGGARASGVGCGSEAEQEGGDARGREAEKKQDASQGTVPPLGSHNQQQQASAYRGADSCGNGAYVESGSWLLFEVMDTGMGITHEGLQALFKEYVQGTEDDMKKPRNRGGTGLGLSICSKQVGVLGGRIGAYSCPDRGSVFWFAIPMLLPRRVVSASQGEGWEVPAWPQQQQLSVLSKPIPTAEDSHQRNQQHQQQQHTQHQPLNASPFDHRTHGQRPKRSSSCSWRSPDVPKQQLEEEDEHTSLKSHASLPGEGVRLPSRRRASNLRHSSLAESPSTLDRRASSQKLEAVGAAADKGTRARSGGCDSEEGGQQQQQQQQQEGQGQTGKGERSKRPVQRNTSRRRMLDAPSDMMSKTWLAGAGVGRRGPRRHLSAMCLLPPPSLLSAPNPCAKRLRRSFESEEDAERRRNMDVALANSLTKRTPSPCTASFIEGYTGEKNPRRSSAGSAARPLNSRIVQDISKAQPFAHSRINAATHAGPASFGAWQPADSAASNVCSSAGSFMSDANGLQNSTCTGGFLMSGGSLMSDAQVQGPASTGIFAEFLSHEPDSLTSILSSAALEHGQASTGSVAAAQVQGPASTRSVAAPAQGPVKQSPVRTRSFLRNSAPVQGPGSTSGSLVSDAERLAALERRLTDARASDSLLTSWSVGLPVAPPSPSHAPADIEGPLSATQHIECPSPQSPRPTSVCPSPRAPIITAVPPLQQSNSTAAPGTHTPSSQTPGMPSPSTLPPHFTMSLQQPPLSVQRTRFVGGVQRTGVNSAEAATFHSAHTHSSTVTTAAPSTAIPAAPKSSLSQAATGDAAKVTSSGTASGVDEVGSTSWGQAGSHWPSPLATDHSPPSLPSAPDFCQGSAAQTAVPLTHSAQQLSLSATTEALPPPIAATPTGTPLSHLNSNTESQLRQHQQHQQFQHQQQVSPSLAVQHVPQTSSSSKRLAALQGCRVLLVEDNPINQTVARKMLSGMKLHCEVASNGVEAVQAVRSGRQFDVVLMDMMMPVMNGVDSTREIRAMGHTELPILAMTANASDRDRDECREAGMNGFLSKPVLKDKLADSITQVLAGSCWLKKE